MISCTLYKFRMHESFGYILGDLMALREEAIKNGYTDLHLDSQEGYDGLEFIISGNRPETDVEYQIRTAGELRQNKEGEDKELKEFKRLQKIYGDKA